MYIICFLVRSFYILLKWASVTISVHLCVLLNNSISKNDKNKKRRKEIPTTAHIHGCRIQVPTDCCEKRRKFLSPSVYIYHLRSENIGMPDDDYVYYIVYLCINSKSKHMQQIWYDGLTQSIFSPSISFFCLRSFFRRLTCWKTRKGKVNIRGFHWGIT